MGPVIASIAILISYKLLIKEHLEKCRKYFLWFTVFNVGMLVLLLLFGWLLEL